MKLNIERFQPCKEGYEYYKSKSSFEEAWNDCERDDWMLWLAYKLEVDDRTYIKAVVLCINADRHLIKDKCSTDIIDTALRYIDGEISRREYDEYFYEGDGYNVFNMLDEAYRVARGVNSLQSANICREVLTEAVFEKVKQLKTHTEQDNN
jgi:hypothetical protein